MKTKVQYVKMCAEFEGASMYDGRGTTDTYRCGMCGKTKLSTYRDKGVTPFMLQCECGGCMTHIRTEQGVASHVDMTWVRPSFGLYRRLSLPMREHIENGGLVLTSDLVGLIPHEYE